MQLYNDHFCLDKADAKYDINYQNRTFVVTNNTTKEKVCFPTQFSAINYIKTKELNTINLTKKLN